MNFSSLLTMIVFTDFQQYKWLRPASRWKICEYQSSLVTVKEFKHSPALPNIKYNCGVLFLVKCISFLTQSELNKTLKTVRILLNFLQGVMVLRGGWERRIE